MLGLIISKIGLLTLVFTLILAWAKGAPGDRAGATAVAVGWIVALALQPLLPHDEQLLMLTFVDGALAAAMLVIAIRYSSLWLGIAMLLQGGVLALHSVALGGGISARNYFVALNISSFSMLFAIIAATVASWLHRRREATRTLAKTAPRPPVAMAGAA